LPGFTNRTLGHFVDAVFIAFPQAGRAFAPRKTHLLGNPIRRAFLDNYLHTKPATDRLSILVNGGSQGAYALNLRVEEALDILGPQIGPRVQVLHQTGSKDQPEVAARYEKLQSTGLAVQAVAFIDDMAQAYAQADLLVCRAGATTIAELTVCKKPAILVPFPYAADDHQTVNARSLVISGAAILLPERDLTGAKLAAELRGIEQDRERLRRMARQSGLLGRPQAAREIAEVCVSLCGRRLVREGRHLPEQASPET